MDKEGDEEREKRGLSIWRERLGGGVPIWEKRRRWRERGEEIIEKRERGLGFCMKRERERETKLKTMTEKRERTAKRNKKRRKKG